MLTFVGRGYSAEFVANFETIVGRLREGASVQLVDGPDDVCAPLCRDSGEAHCVNASVTARDILARTALAAIPELATLVHASHAIRLDSAIVADLRGRFAAGSIRAACAGCEWSSFCTQIAADGFSTARL